MAAGRNVAITGGSGLIGGILIEGLADDHQVTGIARRKVERLDLVMADSTDVASLREAFAGAEVVVDLAARVSGADWPAVRDNNLPSTYNALQAAQQAGVKRVVFASSNHATGMYERDRPYADIVAGRFDSLTPDSFPRIKWDWPVRPDSPYGIAKAFGEAAGRYYSENHGLSVLCLRIGSVVEKDMAEHPRTCVTWQSHRDLVHQVDCCIRAPDDLSFGIYFGVSANTWRIWDLENAAEDIDYRPKDDAEKWR